MKQKKHPKLLLSLLILFSLCTLDLNALEKKPAVFKNSKIDEKIKTQVPGATEIQLSTGEKVSLGSFFKSDKPIILNFVYYKCPMLCHLLLDGLNTSLDTLPESIKSKFNILSISFNPKDSYQTAQSFQKKYSEKDSKNSNWSFAVASPESIKTLTKVSGFNYTKLENSDDFAHSAGLIILTPEGKISRYLYGIMFSPFDLKMAILEASKSKYISTLEQGLLFCYNYNPDENSYGLQAVRVMQLAGLVTILVMGLLFLKLMRDERKKHG